MPVPLSAASVTFETGFWSQIFDLFPLLDRCPLSGYGAQELFSQARSHRNWLRPQSSDRDSARDVKN